MAPKTTIETGSDRTPDLTLHVEPARGRGSLATFLAVPSRAADGLAQALRELHDPMGSADLDVRLGRVAAASPEGTGFLVALEDQVWVFPSSRVLLRWKRGEGEEPLDEPQVVRLSPGESIQVEDDQGVPLGSIRRDSAPDEAPPTSPPRLWGRSARIRPPIDRRVVAAGLTIAGLALIATFVPWPDGGPPARAT